MSLAPRLTLIGLYNFNNSLFSNLILPEGLENEIFIDTLLMKYGECPLISPNMDYMLLAIGAWSRKWYHNIERMYQAISAEYNPIYNYDKHEVWSGTDDLTIAGSRSESGTIERDYENTTEHKVSAYNESTYQEDNKDETEGNDNTGTESSSEHSETRNGTDSKAGHVYGNIGTTKSSEMVKDEIELRYKNNIYDIISELFYKEFCIYIF